MRLSVIGTGYLGATHAAAMAELGHEVIGVDVDAEKIAVLQSGQVPFFEPGLPELLTAQLESGRLRFTTSFEEAAGFADLHFICVGAPQKKGGVAAEMRYVFESVDSVIAAMRPGGVIVGKSTVPAGTCAKLIDRITDAGATLVWKPEVLSAGVARA